jgi:mono/diheme cytochrome c family protein
MKTQLSVSSLCVLGIVAAGWTSQGQGTPAKAGVSRGEYLANSVAMCVQCHSPRTADGTIIADKKFHGAPMPAHAPAWATDWCVSAPPIAGLHGLTDEQFVMLLTEGHAGDRPAPKPPMPPFRMTREDAQAILQYLRSK